MSLNVTEVAGACAEEAKDFCMKITSNPDISGIGVRTAMYVQTVLNMVIPSLFPNNLQIIRNTARATYVLSISLIGASIGQWKTGGLSLLDAIVGTMLATMMTAFATVNRQYIATLGFSLNLTTALFFIFWTYWGFQIWIDPWNFGLRPLPGASDISACTANLDTQFVVVGKSIEATNNGLRIFALVIFGITIIPTIGSIWSVILWTLKVIANGGELEARISEAYRTAKRDRYRIGAGAGKTKLNSMGGFVGLIYMIVTIEQMIKRNGVASDLSDWSLGQSLAVIMLLQQVFDICSWLKEMVQHKRETTEKDRRSSTSSTSSEGVEPPERPQAQTQEV